MDQGSLRSERLRREVLLPSCHLTPVQLEKIQDLFRERFITFLKDNSTDADVRSPLALTYEASLQLKGMRRERERIRAVRQERLIEPTCEYVIRGANGKHYDVLLTKSAKSPQGHVVGLKISLSLSHNSATVIFGKLSSADRIRSLRRAPRNSFTIMSDQRDWVTGFSDELLAALSGSKRPMFDWIRSRPMIVAVYAALTGISLGVEWATQGKVNWQMGATAIASALILTGITVPLLVTMFPVFEFDNQATNRARTLRGLILATVVFLLETIVSIFLGRWF